MLQHTVSAADRVLRDAFESKVLAPAAFTHEAHVRLAYVYLAELDVEAAARRMRESLLGFLEHNGIPRSKFHETLTHAWILAVQHFMDKSSCSSADEFVAKNPELLDSKIMLTHYSAAVLFSADARAALVQPDVDPIPRRAD